MLGIAPGNPLVSMSIAVNILAGITGSASGGMSIALQTLGATWLEMGRAAGIAPDLQSYPDIFMVAVAVPVLALVSVVTLASPFGSF